MFTRNWTFQPLREGEGTGTGTPPVIPPGTPPAAPEAPWGNDVNVPWRVGDKPWYESLIPEGPTREHLKAKSYANPVVLADANYQLTQLATDPKRVVIPDDKADDKALGEFYTKLGRPASPDKYDVKIDPSIKVDPNMLTFGKQLAFDLGLNGKQTQRLVDTWNKYAAGANTELATREAAANDKAIGDLQTALGDKFDTFKASGTRVMQALSNNKNLPEALRLSAADLLAVEKSIGAAPLAKLIGAIGMLTGESDVFTGAGSNNGDPNNPDSMTKEQATAAISALASDAEFQKAYTSKDHPGHKDALERMNKLYAKAG